MKFSGLKLKLVILRRYFYLRSKLYRTYKIVKELKIFNSKETLEYLINNNVSVSRFGDGEFLLMINKGGQFQEPDINLSHRLQEIIHSPKNDKILICIPKTLQSLHNIKDISKLFALEYLCFYAKSSLLPFINRNNQFGDSLFTRFYMMRKNKNGLKNYVNALKLLWNNRNILIIEGDSTKLGVGNDLFNNTNSIRRIICPNENAFKNYDQILFNTKFLAKQNDLILISLGMTATVLAYDLAFLDFQAIDIGHIDIEYEWMIMGAQEKCPIPGKRIVEASNGRTVENTKDSRYLSEIILRIE